MFHILILKNEYSNKIEKYVCNIFIYYVLIIIVILILKFFWLYIKFNIFFGRIYINRISYFFLHEKNLSQNILHSLFLYNLPSVEIVIVHFNQYYNYSWIFIIHYRFDYHSLYKYDKYQTITHEAIALCRHNTSFIAESLNFISHLFLIIISVNKALSIKFFV